MKKLLSILLTLSLIFGLCVGMAGSVSADYYYCDEYSAWDNGDGTCTISYFENPNAVEITVPQYVDGMRVTSISSFCFSEFDMLEKVTLPEGILQIEYNAFYGCWNLKSICLPASLTDMDYNALSDCGLCEIQVAPGSETFCAVDGVLFSKDMHSPAAKI